MTAPCLFACVTRDQIRAAKQPSNKKKEDDAVKYMLDRPGQTDRELNPYWAKNGTGLPSEKPANAESLSLNANTVGDQGVSWLRRALQRAKEQAQESGRTLEEVAAERWGSLEKLEELLSEAEGRKVSLSQHKYEGRGKDYSSDSKYGSWHSKRGDSFKKYDEDVPGRRHYSASRQRNDRKYQDDDDCYRKNESERSQASSSRQSDSFQNSELVNNISRSYNLSYKATLSHHDKVKDKFKSGNYERPKLGFKKPGENEDDIGRELKSSHGTNRVKSWQKPGAASKESISKSDKEYKTTQKKSRSPSPSSSEPEKSSPFKSSDQGPDEQPEILTDKEMNELAAKLVKAEILGNDMLVSKLREKLETARKVRAANSGAKLQSKPSKIDTEVVILSRTDSKGFSRPLEPNSAHPEPVGGRRKKQKAETHSSDGHRVRYFPDDDKHSLQDMFQREKFTTVEDQNEMFAKLAGKDGRQEHDLDMDDIFSERARQKESDGKLEARERGRAIQEHKRKERMLDSCKWCFDGKELQRHLIIAVGAKSYLCLPPYQSLTEGHCLIIPLHHSTCSTQLDEDVWEEMQEFRKALVRMFLADDEDCVLFESAMYLNKFPHMVLHCVPLPREIGDMAPIYFKKAILESETEWATNKKLVDLSKKDIRHSVPKGLPYFSVDFGNEGGFAHVIEDEKDFPSNFAQEIIGGMMDLDHSLWRKPRIENFDKQRRKVLDFSKKWQGFDFTKTSNPAKRLKAEEKESLSD